MKDITRYSLKAKKSRRVAKHLHEKRHENQRLRLNELLTRIVNEVEGKNIPK